MGRIEYQKDCLYQGIVTHSRFEPFRHSFKYKLTYFWFDIKNFKNFFLFKKNKFSLFSFFENDHGPKKSKEYFDKILKNKLKEEINESIDDIKGLCLPRILGYVFNPISIFVCYNKRKPKVIIFEVSNTFNERHAYLCNVKRYNREFSMKKSFYVSPFFNVEGKYKINFSIDRHFVNLFIVYELKKKKVFEASFKGKAMNFSEINLLRVFLLRLFQNLKVTFGIYFQALKLFLKGASYIPKPNKNRNFFTVINKNE